MDTKATGRYEVRLLDDLQKVFCREELSATPRKSNVFKVLQGQRLNFQIAVKAPSHTFVKFDVDSLFRDCVTLRQVGMVFCDHPCDPLDQFRISAEPGFYPDPLLPIFPGELLSMPCNREWLSIWVSVDIPRECPSGKHPLRIAISTAKRETNLKWLPEIPPECIDVILDIIPAELPKQTLWSCSWFHTDCLQKWYHCGFEDERFWGILRDYLKDMAGHGINVLFTPLWSIPLDTAIGWERPTCQLIGITEAEGRYAFDFSLLDRWIETARECGIERFEMVHAFTQWGAAATPKIIVNGERRFGWDVPSDSEEYRVFLDQLLPALTDYLRSKELQGKCIFHNSDEPNGEAVAAYKKCLALLEKHLNPEEFPVFDALSDARYVKEGISRRPIPQTDYFDSFKELDLDARWCYYCCNWAKDVPNRFFGMPSSRNRVLGVLLYACGAEGFLHWGHNFWFSQFSLDQELNPWHSTTAGYGFFGGDSFHVYPGNDGRPVDSIHYEVFSEAMQDYQACQLLEALAGRDAVMEILQEGLERPLKMTDYPHEAEWLSQVTGRILDSIDKRL